MSGGLTEVRGARGRIVTENFGLAGFVVGVAVLFAFLPAGVKWCDLEFAKHNSFYFSYTEALQELFLGALAMTLSAALNYFESQKEYDLGVACGLLTALSVVGGIIALTGFFILYFTGSEMFDPQYDAVGFAWASGAFIVLVIPISSLSVLQARRMKDNSKDRLNARR